MKAFLFAVAAMANKKVSWLIYTVLVGLIPIFCRAIVWLASKSGTVDFLSGADFVALGLVLHISNINEIQHLTDPDHSWVTVHLGISLLFIVFYGVFFALTLLAGAPASPIDPRVAKFSPIVRGVVSLLISYSVYDRISKLS